MFVIMAVLLTGCQNPAPRRANSPGRTNPGTSAAASTDRYLAYVNGQSVTVSDLRLYLLEASGGKVLAEHVLDAQLAQELADRNLTVQPQQLKAERQILAQVLDPDPDQAQRLLDELRQQRGLGETRFSQLLRRNASLRLLVQDEVEISPAAIELAYQLEYGPRFEARLIVVDSLALASDLVGRARTGKADFVDLAIAHSTDSSRAQGGLLPPISPADATFPAAVRQTLGKLAVGQVSDAVALDRGFAILKLERKINARPIRFDEVEQQLALGVRRQVEQILMRRKARTIISQAHVVILDPALNQSWIEQNRRILE